MQKLTKEIDEDEEILNAVPQANDTYYFGGSGATEDEY